MATPPKRFDKVSLAAIATAKPRNGALATPNASAYPFLPGLHRAADGLPRGGIQDQFTLPAVDALRHQFAEPSKKVLDTIIVAQAQAMEGLLSADLL